MKQNDKFVKWVASEKWQQLHDEGKAMMKKIIENIRREQEIRRIAKERGVSPYQVNREQEEQKFKEEGVKEKDGVHF